MKKGAVDVAYKYSDAVPSLQRLGNYSNGTLLLKDNGKMDAAPIHKAQVVQIYLKNCNFDCVRLSSDQSIKVLPSLERKICSEAG